MTRKPAIYPQREEFHALAARGNLVPVYAELVADCETPVSAFQKIDEGKFSFLLESAEQKEDAGRYSFLGSNPSVIFQSHGRNITIDDHGDVRRFETSTEPLAELQKLMSRYRPVAMPDAPRFSGGAVGYMAYDVVRFFEPT